MSNGETWRSLGDRDVFVGLVLFSAQQHCLGGSKWTDRTQGIVHHSWSMFWQSRPL